MRIVSFSGIDGAGKSTQIAEFEKWLHQSGLTTRIFTFWDDVVVLSRWRELTSLKVFKGDPGVGSPEKPVERRDKNVTSFPVTLARLFLYFGDAVSLCYEVFRARKSPCDVVIFDRYIYDELANLPLRKFSIRMFARFVLSIVPQPDLACVIDADPDAAYARKPEYPLEFVRRNREAYLAIANLAGHITVLAPGSVDRMKNSIREEMLKKMPLQRASEEKGESYVPSGGYPPANISHGELIEP